MNDYFPPDINNNNTPEQVPPVQPEAPVQPVWQEPPVQPVQPEAPVQPVWQKPPVQPAQPVQQVNNGYVPYGGAPYTVPPNAAYTSGQQYTSPQSVYGNNPYYGGINPNYVYNGRYVAARNEKKAIRTFSSFTAGAMLAYIVITLIISSIIGFIDIKGLYGTEYYFTSGFDILLSVLGVGVPFVALYLLLRRNGSAQICDEDAPSCQGRAGGKLFT